MSNELSGLNLSCIDEIAEACKEEVGHGASFIIAAKNLPMRSLPGAQEIAFKPYLLYYCILGLVSLEIQGNLVI